MLEVQTYNDIFRGELIHSELFRNVEFSLYDNGIMHIKYPEFVSLDLEIAEYGEKIIQRLNLGKQYFLLEFQTFADISKEAREFGASTRATEHSFVDAIVLQNIGLKIIANAYLKFNKPHTPTKFFNSREKAIGWIFHKMEEYSKE